MDRVRNLINCEYAHQNGIFGNDVGIAILDTGIYLHSDIEERVISFIDFVKYKRTIYDDSSHGTHIAGIIGGNGKTSGGKYMGIAPRCNIIAVKVLDHKGNGNTEQVLQAIQWVIDYKEQYGIKIMNISVGSVPRTRDEEKSKLIDKVEQAWDSGLVVVVAAGNNGPNKCSVTTPGISRKVITVGSCDDMYARSNYGELMHSYSGRGPTKSCIVKPEIVAPGSDIVSCLNAKNGYGTKSGTSMATPIVSGAIALLLEKNPHMTNKEVKIRLHDSAVDIGLPKNQQGWGMVNVRKLLG